MNKTNNETPSKEAMPEQDSIDFWTRDGERISLSRCTNCGDFTPFCHDHYEGHKFADDIFLCPGCRYCNGISAGTPVEEVRLILASNKYIGIQQTHFVNENGK